MRVERGKGWEMHLGDCIEIMPRLGPVDHVVTDPPYSAWVHAQEKKAGARRDGSRSLPAINFASLTPAAMVKAGAAIAASTVRWAVVFSDAESNAAWRHALEPLRHIRVGAWAKPDASPQFSGDRPSASFELIQISHAASRCRWNGGGRHGIWTYGVERTERHHATPKPVPLMLALVADFTDPEETILDPFCGSASTGVACLRLGRKFIGIEKDPTYFALACERLRAEEQGSTLQAARAGQLPLLG